MNKAHTKEAAEAILYELPSVLGAFVREDVNGHPREVHVLIGPGPEPRLLARDIRDLLEERLGVFVDQRIISIAQIADHAHRLPLEEWTTPGPVRPAAEPAERATAAPSPPTFPPDGPSRTITSDLSPNASVTGANGTAGRLVFEGVESTIRSGRIEVRVMVSWRGRRYEGEGEEIEGRGGRVRAAASAALRAATLACDARIRLELESASVHLAFGREYVLVTGFAVSPLVGRKPLPLAGAHPVDAGAEIAAALAALQASNRVLALALFD